MSNESRILLEGEEQILAMLLEQMHAVRRYYHLYTPGLPPALFEHPDYLSAIRARVAEQPRIRMQFILPGAKAWRRQCPQFLQLSERLRSAMHLRVLPTEEPRERELFQRLFAVGDRSSVLELADLHRLLGGYQHRHQARARQLLSFFNEIWEKSGPDPELRRLMI